jgi:N-acetylneuraminate epimerase
MVGDSSGLAFTAEAFPALPVSLRHGVGARLGHVVYAGLGSAGTQWYALDLGQIECGWRRLADFPAEPREQSACSVIGGKIYIFGGTGQIPARGSGPDTVIHRDVHCFDTADNRWRKLNTQSPRALLGAAVVTTGDCALFFGGVSQALFEGLFRDLKAADAVRRREIEIAYFSMVHQDYGFSDECLSYEPAANAWRVLGKLPFAPVVGAAAAVDGGTATLLNGELKPGLRAVTVHRANVVGDSLQWDRAPDLIAPQGESVQEGLAGAFAGYSDGTLLVAGGANFRGARECYRQGQHYAHRGLQKTWRDDIYALVEDRWCVAGRLPDACAYGLSIQLDDGVLLVGGETHDGEAHGRVRQLRWSGRRAIVT